MNFLVTGGAGYIGSHMVKFLQQMNYDPVIIDNFSTGNKWAIKNCEVINANLEDYNNLSKLLQGRKYDAVFHFASKSIVSESFKRPEAYMSNNLDGTCNLIKVMRENNNNFLIFSSSAAIYGKPLTNKIKENHPKKPISVYGKSKLLCEEYMKKISQETEMRFISLRYFNVAGASNDAKIGEFHKPETHLIPQILNSIHTKTTFSINGNDYDTKDGTCVRDYVHVNDIIKAHYKAFINLKENRRSSAYNLANGKGYSILDVIKKCEEVTGLKIKYKFCKRREGDPATLIADYSKAMKELEWKPSYMSNLENIISTSWKWHNYFLSKYL